MEIWQRGATFFFFFERVNTGRKKNNSGWGGGGEWDLYHKQHILWPHWPSAAAKGREVRWFETKAVKKRRMATSRIMSLTTSCLPYREQLNMFWRNVILLIVKTAQLPSQS